MNDSNTEQIEQIARAVQQRGMQMPVLFMLEMFRPFTGCFSLLAEGFAPCLNIFLGRNLLSRIQAVLGDRESLEQLINRIEELDQGVINRG